MKQLFIIIFFTLSNCSDHQFIADKENTSSKKLNVKISSEPSSQYENENIPVIENNQETENITPPEDITGAYLSCFAVDDPNLIDADNAYYTCEWKNTHGVKIKKPIYEFQYDIVLEDGTRLKPEEVTIIENSELEQFDTIVKVNRSRIKPLPTHQPTHTEIMNNFPSPSATIRPLIRFSIEKVFEHVEKKPRPRPKNNSSIHTRQETDTSD